MTTPATHTRLTANMAAGIAAHVVNIVLFMAMYPVYLHYLGYARYGVWLALGTVVAFAQLGELGIGAAVAKLVAESHGRGNDATDVPACFAAAVLLMATSGSAIMLLVLLARTPLLSLFAFAPDALQAAERIFPAIAGLSLLAIVSQPFPALLEGLGRIDLAHGIRTGGRLAGFACTVAMLAAGYGLSALVAGNTVAFLAICASSLVAAARLTPYPLLARPVFERTTLARMLHFGAGLTAGRVAGMLVDPFNRIMLTRFAGVDTVPVYDIAFRGCQTLRAFADMSLRALLPEASRLHALGSVAARATLRAIFRRYTAVLLAIAVGVGVPLAAAAHPLLALWLRGDLHPTQPAIFRIILAGTCVSMVSIPAYNIALGIGDVRRPLLSHVIQAVGNAICLALCAYALPRLTPSVAGWCLLAAWSAAAAYIIAATHHQIREPAR